MWEATPTEFPSLKERFTLRQQLARQRELEGFIADATAAIRKKHGSEEEPTAQVEAFRASVAKFIGDSLEHRYQPFGTRFFDDFSNVTDDFVNEAKQFDSQVDFETIHQALRNVWIINSIQVYLEKEVKLTPSAFAYSMLYPYTDNYLDDPTIPVQTKREFTHLLRQRLAGEKVEATNSYEDVIFELVSMIEGEYPRPHYPSVYQSLLAIHRAQEKGLSQQEIASPLNDRDILRISVEKGGTSVLADGYLANGTLPIGAADFAFGYGVFLQLIDDLQDLDKDQRKGHLTIFSRIPPRGHLDNITNRLLAFVTSVLSSANQFLAPQAEALSDLSERSCIAMVLEAVARDRNMYTEAYIRTIEEYSPLRLAYMRTIKQKLKKRYASLRKVGVVRPLDSSTISLRTSRMETRG
ncbi:MAG: hypothetical protein AABZ61_13555 [Bacteroidota bacterium]